MTAFVLQEVLVNGKIPVQWDGNKTKCKGCGKQIGWGFTENEKRMPFDFDPQNTTHWKTCEKAGEFK